MFVGIPLGAAGVSELAALRKRLEAPGDGLRWSAEAGWHITLQFLGSTREGQFQCVSEGLHRIRAARFVIELEAPDFFERVGVFFVGVRPSPELVSLQKQVTETTAPCGFAAEERPYHPHITLARSKGGRAALKALAAKVPQTVKFSRFTADRFVLYESIPGPGGSRYEVRSEVRLS